MSDPTVTPPPPPPATPPPPPAPPRERTWFPLLGVIVVILVVGFGGFVVAGEPRQVVDDPDPDPDPLNRVEIIPGVTLAPVQGWEVNDRYLQPVGEDEIDAVRLSSGTASFDVLAGTYQGSPEDLFLIYVEQVLLPFADQLQVSDQVETFTTDQGYRGVRGFYLGVFPDVQAPIEGELSAVLTPGGLGLISDGWTTEGQLARVIDATRAMTASVEEG